MPRVVINEVLLGGLDLSKNYPLEKTDREALMTRHLGSSSKVVVKITLRKAQNFTCSATTLNFSFVPYECIFQFSAM